MKSIQSIKRCVAGLLAALLTVATLTSCTDEDLFDTNVVGKTYQGSIVVSGRGTTNNLYGQLIYRFLSPGEIEVVAHRVEKIGTTTVYGISGPDTIAYEKNRHILTIRIEDENGTTYPHPYEGRVVPAGLEIWAAGDMEGLLTLQKLPDLEGTQWAIKAATGVAIPSELTGARLSFTDGKVNIVSDAGSANGLSYRAVSHAMVVEPFTIDGMPYGNLVLLHYYYNKVSTIHTNINGLGVTFAKVTS